MITIKKALKLKNDLVKEINFIYSKIYQENVAERPTVSVSLLFDNYFFLTNKLIELKKLIHEQTLPVREEIFTLSEKKNMLNKLNSVNCKESVRFVGDDEKVIKPIIDTVKMGEVIKQLKIEINDLQERLDEFNYNNKIDFDFDVNNY